MASRTVLTQASNTLKQLSRNPNNNQRIQLVLSRDFSKRTLTPSISFLTNGELGPKNSKTLSEFRNEDGRPLSILLCWLMSKPNAVQKYSQFYLDQGFDVLTVRISPWQLLWPASYNPIVQNELLPILNSSNHEKKLIHGFSVGGYIFSQLLKNFQTEPVKYQPLMKSIRGQIWDSVVDVNGLSVGVSKSVFLKSALLQKALQNYIEFHIKIFYHVATKYYDEAHDNFYYKPLRAPALFLSSKIDPISTMDVINEIDRCWNSVGITCRSRVWDNTNHVGHMQRYPEEYKDIVNAFLRKIDWSSKNFNIRKNVVYDEIMSRPRLRHVPTFA